MNFEPDSIERVRARYPRRPPKARDWPFVHWIIEERKRALLRRQALWRVLTFIGSLSVLLPFIQLVVSWWAK